MLWGRLKISSCPYPAWTAPEAKNSMSSSRLLSHHFRWQWKYQQGGLQVLPLFLQQTEKIAKSNPTREQSIQGEKENQI